MKSETHPYDDDLGRGDNAGPTDATGDVCHPAGPVPWWDDPANIPLLRQLVQEGLDDIEAGRIVDGPTVFRELRRNLRRRRSSTTTTDAASSGHPQTS